MEFSVTFYSTRDGKKSVVAFLNDLRAADPKLHKLLVAGLKKLEHASIIEPLTEQVDAQHAIFEVRVGGKNIARAVFFFRSGQEVVVTNGYVKKTQKVDRGELDKAIAYKRDWETRHP